MFSFCRNGQWCGSGTGATGGRSWILRPLFVDVESLQEFNADLLITPPNNLASHPPTVLSDECEVVRAAIGIIRAKASSAMRPVEHQADHRRFLVHAGNVGGVERLNPWKLPPFANYLPNISKRHACLMKADTQTGAVRGAYNNKRQLPQPRRSGKRVQSGDLTSLILCVRRVRIVSLKE